MKTNGYTLAESLVALMIVGLASAGLAQASGQLRAGLQKLDGSERHLGSLSASERMLDDFLRQSGSDGESVRGDHRRLLVGAGECSLELHDASGGQHLEQRCPGRAVRSISVFIAARFAYITQSGQLTDEWPPENGDSASLKAVAILDQGRPFAIARIWRNETAHCAFDLVAGRCRPAPS